MVSKVVQKQEQPQHPNHLQKAGLIQEHQKYDIWTYKIGNMVELVVNVNPITEPGP